MSPPPRRASLREAFRAGLAAYKADMSVTDLRQIIELLKEEFNASSHKNRLPKLTIESDNNGGFTVTAGHRSSYKTVPPGIRLLSVTYGIKNNSETGTHTYKIEKTPNGENPLPPPTTLATPEQLLSAFFWDLYGMVFKVDHKSLHTLTRQAKEEIFPPDPWDRGFRAFRAARTPVDNSPTSAP